MSLASKMFQTTTNTSRFDPVKNNASSVNNFAAAAAGNQSCGNFRPNSQTQANRDCKPLLARIISSNVSHSETNQQQDVPGELLFVEQHDVVTIEQVYDDKWFLARSEQQYGKLASSCCQILDDTIPLRVHQYLIDNQHYDLHVCFASFVAQDVGDLSITRGDIIVAINQVNEHWMQGQVCFDSQANCWPKLVSSQQVGTFPLNHCWRLDSERVKNFCHDRVKLSQQLQHQQQHQHQRAIPSARPSSSSAAHSASLSSGSSSYNSSDNQQQHHHQHQFKPPPRPQQLPQQMAANKQQYQQQQSQQLAVDQPPKASMLTGRQQDKLKGWLHTVKKKTARLSTRITASLGLISLTRDEEFEKHYERFKHIEKSIRVFIKNLSAFVEHFENFLLSLQNTSENLSDFYRDKSHQKELDELRRKNKALACEHFHAFKRTVERQVILAATQLLQKFSGPHQLVSKRSAKLLDYDNKTKVMESCRDLEKKAALRDQYVIAKDIYDRINKQLIDELPLFNRCALDIFRECVLVLLDGRRNLILAYTRQTASLLDTPLMLTYTASDVASSILMSCELSIRNSPDKRSPDLKGMLEQERKDSGQTSGHDTRQNSGNDDDLSRPPSVSSQLSSEFQHLAQAAREISSTPLSHVSESLSGEGNGVIRTDTTDCAAFNRASDAPIGPRSSVVEVSNSDEGIQSAKRSLPKERKKKKFQIYIASWPFVATGPNQLTIACKQPLKLVKGCDECGNPDWSLVQDKKGQLGYVPSSYIKKKD